MSLKVLVDKVQRAQDLLKQGKRLTIQLNSNKYAQDEMNSKLSLLKEVMKNHPGSTTFVLQVQIPEIDRTVDLEVSDPRGIDPSLQFFENVTNILDEPKWTLT